VEPIVNSVDAVKQYGVDKVAVCLFLFSFMVQFFTTGFVMYVRNVKKFGNAPKLKKN